MLSNYFKMQGAKNIKTKVSAKQSLGLYELKQHKPWFCEEYLQLLNKGSRLKYIRLWDPNQCNVDNLNNVKH